LPEQHVPGSILKDHLAAIGCVNNAEFRDGRSRFVAHQYSSTLVRARIAYPDPRSSLALRIEDGKPATLGGNSEAGHHFSVRIENGDSFAVLVLPHTSNDITRLIENEGPPRAGFVEYLQDGLPLRIGYYKRRFDASRPLKRARERDLRGGGSSDGKPQCARHADEYRGHEPSSDSANKAKLGFGFLQPFEHEIPFC
jgi:hypothetical protein